MNKMKKWVWIAMIGLTTVLLAGVGTAAPGTVNLIEDGAFNTISGNLPDVGTTPWGAVEGAAGAVKTETAFTRSSPKAVLINYYWNEEGFYQDLGVQVESGEDYVIDLWHAGKDYSTGKATAAFDVSILTSPTSNGTYTAAVTRSGIVCTNTSAYLNYSNVVTAAELSGVVGEYMRFQILKSAPSSDHRVLIDDVAVYGPGEVPDLHPTLVSFSADFPNPDSTVPDLTSEWTGHTVPRTDANSSDGTFGTIANPAADIVELNCVTVNSGTPTATLTLINTNNKAVYLDDIHFDAGRFYAGAPKDFTLTSSGDITATNLASGSDIVVMGKVGDADDYDVPLSNLVDNVLLPNEQAVFSFTFSGATDGASTILDNVLVGGTVSEDPAPAPAVLAVNPDEIAMSFTDVTSILTNTFEVSYKAGYPPTNVNVSTVSVINDASGGFSVTPTSFVLNDPTPSNQVVEVIFNNNTALLDPNDVATADVQLIWNELGSAVVSTSTVPVSATRLGFLEENVIAAFHSTSAWQSDSGGGGDADIALNGIITEVSGIQWGKNNAGSTDTSYGTLLGDAPTDGGAGQIMVDYNGGHIYIALTNNTQSPVELDSLHFDVANKYDDNPDESITVTLDGALGNGIVLATVSNLINSANGMADYDDYDVDLSSLPDLQHGDGIVLTFTYTGSGMGMLDNVALLGTGISPAVMSRVGGSTATLGVSGLDLSVSQDIDLLYVHGVLETNIVVTGVSFANEDVPGAFSAVGSFPVELLTPEITNSAVFSLEFDNTVANLPAGTEAYAEVIVEFDEPGGGPRTYSFDAVAVRPADAPSGAIALFDTEFFVPDAAYNGVLGRFADGAGIEFTKGSMDETYGSMPDPFASTNSTTTWSFQGGEPVATLTVTNQTTAAIELSTFNFDIGRWYNGATNFTVSVSGDVTANPTLLESSLGTLGYKNNDYEDHDIDLTVLADHTLGAYESVTFTFTLGYVSEGNMSVGTWIDNIALMGTADVIGGWSSYWGLTSGVNDGSNDNPDGDSRDNLMEYATGGDPMTADGSAATLWTAEEGGTNWLYHVHNERQDDDSLTYGVGTKWSLQYAPSWDAGDAEEVGTTTGPGLWKTVTNRTAISEDAKFIGLEVNQN